MPNSVLKIDVDYPFPEKWFEEWQNLKTAVLNQMGFKVEKIIVKKSPSGRGKHLWIHITTPKPLTDMEKLKLEWLMGDQQARVWINLQRIKRGVKKWDKLFTRHLWVKPPDPKCRKCHIRKFIEETLKAVE